DWREAVRTGTPLNNEFRLRGPDGSWRWTNVCAAPLCDASGVVRKWVGMNVDITARKEVEARLREALVVAETARSEAERANRMLNDFFARASHELRGPLGAMALWLEQARSLRPAQRAKALSAVEQSIAKQTRLVADLLDTARSATGKLRVERSLMNFAA